MKNYKEKQCSFNNCKIIFKPASGRQIYCENCKENANNAKKKQTRKIYYEENKKEIITTSVIYYWNNKDKKKIYDRKYYLNNIDRLKEEDRAYRLNNRNKINKYNRAYIKNRLQNDKVFKLRTSISRSINVILKKNFSSKNNQSCLKYLPYTTKELKQHIESLFETWMCWANWGIYDPMIWDDENPLTWTWQLDHKTPQSQLLYTSMTDDNFKICWSLDNLRPLSAKQNIIDGATRIRHKK